MNILDLNYSNPSEKREILDEKDVIEYIQETKEILLEHYKLIIMNFDPYELIERKLVYPITFNELKQLDMVLVVYDNEIKLWIISMKSKESQAISMEDYTTISYESILGANKIYIMDFTKINQAIESKNIFKVLLQENLLSMN